MLKNFRIGKFYHRMSLKEKKLIIITKIISEKNLTQKRGLAVAKETLVKLPDLLILVILSLVQLLELPSSALLHSVSQNLSTEDGKT